MFPWLPVILVAYLITLLVGLVMCFVARPAKRRRYIRIGIAVLSLPLWGAIAIGVWINYKYFPEPPTLAELERSYPAKRADLETILRMSNEDANYSRIAPDFVDRTPNDPNEIVGRYSRDDPEAKLAKPRWDAYREIYRRNGIKLGVHRNGSHDAFIMVDSVGLLDSGHTSGYLYCAPDGPPDAYRFEPCSLKQDRGERDFDGTQEGYSFQRLSEHWFAFDQGPS